MELRLLVADVTSLDRIITADFPRIRAVMLVSSPDSIAHIRTSVHFHQSFHNAQRLTLMDIEPPISSLSRFHALRSLALSDEYGRASVDSFPIVSFLAMLRLQSQLESLMLDTVPFVIPSSLDTMIPRFHLPSLSTLYLSATMSVAAVFLSSLQFPCIRRLHLVLTEFLGNEDHAADIVFREAGDLAGTMELSPSTIWTGPMHAIVVEHNEGDAYLHLESIPGSFLPNEFQAHLMASAIRRLGGHGIHTLEIGCLWLPQPHTSTSYAAHGQTLGRTSISTVRYYRYHCLRCRLHG